MVWYYNIITHDDRKDGFVWILFFLFFNAYYIVCYAFIVLGGLFPSTAVNVSAVVNNLPARTKYSHDTYRLTKLLRLFTTADDKYLKIFCTRIYARWIRTCVKTSMCLKKTYLLRSKTTRNQTNRIIYILRLYVRYRVQRLLHVVHQVELPSGPLHVHYIMGKLFCAS